MILENKIRELIQQSNPDPFARFDVVAYELWGNAREGFETNCSWHIAKDADLSEVLDAVRGRWEVFKLNYLPKARVSDIQDTGFDSTLSGGGLRSFP